MAALLCCMLLGPVACAGTQGSGDAPTAAISLTPKATIIPSPTLTATAVRTPSPTSTVTASATVTMSPTATVPPTGTAIGGLVIKSTFGARPGGIAQVVVQTVPGASCAIEHVLPNGRVNSGRELLPSRASGTGVVLWKFPIPSDAQPGQGRVIVSCNGVSAASIILTEP